MFRLIYIPTIIGFLLCAEGVSSDNISGCSEPLGVEDKNIITDGQMSASSRKSSSHEAFQGRLNNDHDVRKLSSWCPDKNDDRQWLQVDFNETKIVSAVATQGDPEDSYLFVATYALLYSYDGMVWYNYTIDRKVHIFPGGRTKDMDKVKKNIPVPITTRFIRINPRTWSLRGHGFCLRVEFYGCSPQEDCFTPVGMKDGRINNSQVTSSDTYKEHYPYNGRLDNMGQWGAWCSQKEKDPNLYLQIDLLRKRNISAVATQGYMVDMYVKRYRLNYSTDGNTWMSIQDAHGQIEFNGNQDNDTIKKNSFYHTITARFIRFNPTKWKEFGYICMRVEIYECLPVKGSVPNVNKTLPRFSDVDKGGSINLTCVMGGQARITIDWFKGNVLVQKSSTTRLKKSVIGVDRMKSTLSLSNVTLAHNGIKYECKGSYPGVTDLVASSTTVLRVGADQPALNCYDKTSSTLVLSVPYRKTNVTKQYLFEYKRKNSTEKKWKAKHFDVSKEDGYTIPGLQPWTFYEVKVTPKHGQGKGRTSVTVNCQTDEAAPGPPRTIKVIRVNEYNVTVKWQPPRKEDMHGIITKYIIKYSANTDDKPLVVHVRGATNHTIISLLPNTKYTFQISSVTGGGESPFSRDYTFTTSKEIIGPRPPVTPKPKKEKVNLEKLNKINITQKNVMNVAVEVKNLTSDADKLKPKDVDLTAEILEKIVETNTKNSKVGDNILVTISQVLDIKDDVLAKSNSTSKFVKILEDYIEGGGNFTKNATNIIVRVDRIAKRHTGGIKKEFGKNAIEIPEEVLKDAENKTIYFIYYKTAKLFHSKLFIKEICLDNGFTENVYQETTAVLSSGLAGKSLKNLSSRVIINFTVADPKAVTESSSCVYWDFHEAGGAGDWSNKGCTRLRVINNTIECACDHMTNFAAILDVYAETSKSCGVHADVLTMISYFGCVLSITGLSLTIFTYLFFRRLRKELAAKILIQLCIALLCVLVVFVIGIERSRVGPIGCYIVAVLLHYFILAAFLWMLIEAHFMYLAFVKVWSHHGEHELLKCSLIAWGLPVIVVAITMLVNLDNYGGNHYCRIEKIAFFAAFFAPILCIVFVNLVVFTLILYKLNTRPDSTLGKERNATAQRMKQAVGIMILVGITWIFGALAISRARLIFHYLFVAFNSMQGFSIFVFYCLSQKNVRDCWKALLTCKLKDLQKDKSFYTNTYDRRRCSTASTTHNNTLSLARKKTSTSSGNTAYPSRSLDTLTRDFTSFNCSSGTLRLSNGNKPNNLNNFVAKDCNIRDANNESDPDVWKRISNVPDDDDESNAKSSLTPSQSFETLCSDDDTDKCHTYDLVDNSNFGSLVSLNSSDLNMGGETSNKKGFYSFVNSKNSLGSNCTNSLNNSLHCENVSQSAPGTPDQMKRPRPSPLSKKKQTTLPPPLERSNVEQTKEKHISDPFAVRDDFGKLIVNPCRGSIRGVIGVVETSVDVRDEDSPDLVTPQQVRLTQDFNGEQGDKFDPNECIASPAYFAENRRVSHGSKDRNSSTNSSTIGDICL